MEEEINKILLANFKEGNYIIAQKQLLDLFTESNLVCDNCEGKIFKEHRLGKMCINCGVIK